MSLYDKGWEFWVAAISVSLYIYEKSAGKTFWARISFVIMSTSLGASLSPDLAEWSGRGETLSLVVIAAFGYILLDLITSLVADREWLKQLIKDFIQMRLGR